MSELPGYMQSSSDVKKPKKDVGDTQTTSVRRYIDVVSVSGEDPTAPAGKTGMPIRMNAYQKDILEIASKKQGLTKSGYIRQAFMEQARKEGIF